MVRILDDAALGALERVLAGAGDLLERTPAGHSVEYVTGCFRSAGVVPSSEAVTWWSWRDGSGLDILPGLGHLSLRTALDGLQRLKALAADAAEAAEGRFRDPNVWWDPAWVPIFDTGGLSKIALDCGAVGDGLSPLRQVDWNRVGQEDYADAFAASLGTYICRAVEALADGRYRYSTAKRVWQPEDWADFPAGQRF